MGGVGLAATNNLSNPEGSVDIFFGTLVHHADPVPYAASTGPGHIIGSIHMLSFRTIGSN